MKLLAPSPLGPEMEKHPSVSDTKLDQKHGGTTAHYIFTSFKLGPLVSADPNWGTALLVLGSLAPPEKVSNHRRGAVPGVQ